VRINRLAGKALVVLAMALMGWISPTSASMLSEPGCDEWFCAEMESCDEEEIERMCDAFCPDWFLAFCESAECPVQGKEDWAYVACVALS
jgi:hypothetical protein